MTSAAI